MKIRYYKDIDGWRWTGFLLAMVGALYFQMPMLKHNGWVGLLPLAVVPYGFIWASKIATLREH